MIGVLIRVSFLRLVRDPAGLLMVFLLPPVVFLIFASVFSGAASARIELRAGIVDKVASAKSRALVREISRRLDGRLQSLPGEADLRRAIDTGDLDAGVVLSPPLDAPAPAARVLAHPARRAAGAILRAAVEEAARTSLAPDLARREALGLGPFLGLTPAQRRRVDLVPFPSIPPPPFSTEVVVGSGDPLVTYYAAAVGMLFLMFTAVQGAMILIDERLSGLRLRLAIAAGGQTPLLLGRFAWLTGLGAAQTAFLFAVAAVLYRAPILREAAPLLCTAVLAAAACAGLALALAAACSSREQAQTVSTVLILILAAVGGAMVPRFLMPRLLQDLGWLTPHAWAIETFQATLWSQDPGQGRLRAWCVLALFALSGLLASVFVETRRRL